MLHVLEVEVEDPMLKFAFWHTPLVASIITVNYIDSLKKAKCSLLFLGQICKGEQMNRVFLGEICH